MKVEIKEKDFKKIKTLIRKGRSNKQIIDVYGSVLGNEWHKPEFVLSSIRKGETYFYEIVC